MSFGVRSSFANKLAPNIATLTAFQSHYEKPVPSAPPAPISQQLMCGSACPWSTKTIVCYTPKHAEDIASCSLHRNDDKLVFTTDLNAAIVPAGAIIDSIEFFGIDDFCVKDTFSIGLGQLNQGISFPLIQDSDPDIANERVGGCREFTSYRSDGKNEKNIVLCNSNINVHLNQPIISGGLQIIIRYHFKLI
jgi:hypothetical protein